MNDARWAQLGFALLCILASLFLLFVLVALVIVLRDRWRR